LKVAAKETHPEWRPPKQNS